MTRARPNRRQIVLGIALVAILIGVFGALVCALGKLADQESLRRRHAAMTIQIAEIKSGKIDCLVNPDPDFLDELLADAECKVNLKTVYLGSDAADPRFGRLRELPKLQSLVFFWTENPEPLLERLRGMESVEAISFDRCVISAKGFEHVASLPNLKSLGVPLFGKSAESLNALKDHPYLEQLTLRRVKFDKDLLPLLQSLSRLKSVTVQTEFEETGKANNVVQMLRANLPNCQCSVRDGDGG
jgi:hypothetical protein